MKILIWPKSCSGELQEGETVGEGCYPVFFFNFNSKNAVFTYLLGHIASEHAA